ncbi:MULTISPECIES: 1,2-phenylacetyl-CoA epoxidase subunit PaaD [unclassified Thermoactinomyces]|uniref:1,2-phenylacetyl-CoA epoxidase subunit PaaD n=1 Tax=unclassified Thermoactinomyces TaxID=2634588 RepID=UPI0018DD0625|nr:phenylacetate-CoA oxygenase subunit PaaJ [Thermoactinomyces sp. CICC 10523]MBH8604084.1 phenylacetate-CoA oxygenase subunit PaaJ [Thermoactinomyces sp. CICC 10522]MBH8606381.1 phenylacetate-CoA oxygenase subunit PaaJ [Thermoactinomyces sp. CICC 10521]
MTETEVWDALKEVTDPEIPTVSVVDMGMVNRVKVSDGTVEVEMLPTFVGCPALDLIRKQVEQRLLKGGIVREVQVTFLFDPPWTSDRITDEGKQKLKQFGIAPPVEGPAEPPPCPYCGQAGADVINLFGPTACRAIYYCKRCHQPFEGMKKV